MLLGAWAWSCAVRSPELQLANWNEALEVILDGFHYEEVHGDFPRRRFLLQTLMQRGREPDRGRYPRLAMNPRPGHPRSVRGGCANQVDFRAQ